MSIGNPLSHSVVEYVRTLEVPSSSGALTDFTGMDGELPLMVVGVSLVESTPEGLASAFSFARKVGLPRVALEECALQSYLFLGFPRMISALEALAQCWPVVTDAKTANDILALIAPEPKLAMQHWQDGLVQCKTIYGTRFDDLAAYMNRISPTLLSWMILEGYGKVLSRPGLQVAERELLNVSMLLLEARERQLFAHIRGALNSGVLPDRLRRFIAAHFPFSEPGTHMAQRIADRLIGS